MIDGWLSRSDELDAKLLEAPLPELHTAVYRDGAVAVPVPGAGSLVVRQADGNEVEVAAGLDAEGRAAVEVVIVKAEVFHALVVDRVEIDFGWQGCGEAPSTSWQQCE